MNFLTDAASLFEKLLSTFPELSAVPGDVFVVGGAVRDVCLGRQPIDIDFAAKDARIAAANFATLTGGTLIEIGREPLATFRVVVRRRVYDFNSISGGSIEQDALRRDFTMNAIALEPRTPRLVDPTGGMEDLRHRLIRMIREQNFSEDPLRVLKGVRMAVAFDFTIEPRTLEAIHRHVPELEKVAPERIAYELDLILSSDERVRGLVLLNELGLDLRLFGFSFSPDLIEAVALSGGNDPVAAYGMLFFERGEKAVNDFAERWRWGDRKRRETLAAIAMAQRVHSGSRAAIPILIYDFGLDAARRAVQILHAVGSDRAADDLGELLDARGETIAEVTPLLEGERIQREAGLEPGPEVGRLKRAVLEAQLRGEISTEDEALRLLRDLL